MKKIIKKVFVALMAIIMLVSVAPVQSKAATVTQGSYDFSQMVVRRVWFNIYDPCFLIDNYQRVWLDKNSNVIAKGDISKLDSTGSLLVPMKEVCAQLGISYQESGNTVKIVLNGDTLEFTVDSQDVKFNGTTLTGELTTAQKPQLVNVKSTFPEYNTYLSDDYSLTYLPVTYIFSKFGIASCLDSSVNSLYAAVPIMKTSITPTYSTVAEGYGNRYGDIQNGTSTSDVAVADNIVALQNADGGWQSLPVNINMAQADIVNKIGSLRSTSTLLDGATTGELRYLAKFITESKPSDIKYQVAFKKGLDFLTVNQNACGGWQIAPTAAKGFNANIGVGNNVTVSILSLLSDVAVLNNQNYVFARRMMDVTPIKAIIDKGNTFLISSQIAYDNVKGGWASQYKTDGTTETMGRTYERESVSSFTTKAVVEYLMSVRQPSVAIKDAVNSGIEWLNIVKIKDKEEKIVKDLSMNNGFDIYLVDGNGTWASNYTYDITNKVYKPLYSDVDPTRPSQKAVNTYDVITEGFAASKASSYKGADFIYYATRTTIKYYDNSLAVETTGINFTNWNSYIANGFPALPVDPKAVEISVPADKVIDSSVFADAQAKGITVQFNVTDSYGNTVAKWTFDGNTITNPTPISLGVVINAISTNAQKIIDKANATDKALTIHFDYSGVLPGPATVQINVANKFADGTQLKLYYYNESTGKLEYQDQTITVTNGYAEFTITHCSDYVLSDVSLDNTLDNSGLPNTGDQTNILLYVLIGISALSIIGGLFVYTLRRKKEL